MGMFDDIQSDALRCPLCGKEIRWQSKDGPCLMEELTVHELMDRTSCPTIYSGCNECSIWIEVSIRRQQGRTTEQWKQFHKEHAIIQARSAESQ